MKEIYEKVLRLLRLKDNVNDRYKKVMLFCKYKLGYRSFNITQYVSYYKGGRCIKMTSPKITGKIMASSFKDYTMLVGKNLETEKRVYL